MQQYILQTPRLILRPLTAADAKEVFIWCSDPLVNRFMPYALYTKTEDVRRWLETVEKNEKQYEFGFVCKENNRLIGSGGIGPAEDNTQWEIGYNLRSDCWNQGYATEAAKAMILTGVKPSRQNFINFILIDFLIDSAGPGLS